MKSVQLARKYRWKFSAEFPGNKLSERLVKIKERPTLHIVEKENSDGSFCVEKQTWAPLIMSFYDIKHGDNLQDLYEMLAKFYGFGAEIFKKDVPTEELEKITDMLGAGKMVMYDGIGTPLEEWSFAGLWPHSVNFGDLCYSSSDEAEIEITWRYKECFYKNLLSETKSTCEKIEKD